MPQTLGTAFSRAANELRQSIVLVHGEVAEAERGAFLPLPESHIASFSAGVTQQAPILPRSA
jgi:hypothetical protein